MSRKRHGFAGGPLQELERMVPLMAMLLLAVLESGCAGPVKGLFPPAPGQTPKTIYVLYRGLHTGFVIPDAEIPDHLWPERHIFSHSEYFETGWGDVDGYRYPLTTRLVLKAMFCSKGSVILVDPFSASLDDQYAGIATEIVQVELSPEGFARLCAYIQNTYELNALGKPIPLSSVYKWENFFLAKGRYSLFHTCNTWTATGLRAAGCPIAPRLCELPQVVMFETRRFGRVIWKHGHPLKTVSATKGQPQMGL